MNTAANLNGSTPGRSSTTAACAAQGHFPWRRMLANAMLLVIGFLMASCSGQIGPDYLSNLDADLKFYADTAVMVNPGSAEIRRGQQVTTVVTSRHKGLMPRNVAMSAVDPRLPGVRIEVTPTTPSRLCVGNELPAGEDPSQHFCHDWRVTVSADAPATAIGRITLSVQWGGEGGRTIERLAYFDVGLIGVPASPGFELAVGGTDAPKVYAISGTVPILLQRSGGFTEPVTLELDALGSGITGFFLPNPAPADASTLHLNVPARYAEGGMVDLRVSARGGGVTRTLDFKQRIEPLFTMTLSPPLGAVSPAAPLEVVVTLSFDAAGPFAAAPPRIALTTGTLPAGVSTRFEPDANPPAFTTGRTITRTLRVSSDGSVGATATVGVVATLDVVPDDLGARPYIARALDLMVAPPPSWEYLENGASYDLTENDAVGVVMQSNSRPAIAWLEGRPGGVRKVYLKRFDGTTFVASPSPGKVNGLIAPADGDIDEARLALSRADVARVAFTYRDETNEGIGVVLGSSAGAAWTSRSEYLAAAGEHVRSPRLAAAGDALALSYIVEADAPTGTSRLFVKGSLVGAAITPLPGPQAGGALNFAGDGRVLRHASALALRSDGNPWVAWIEQPAGPAPAALWLRSYDGAAWSGAIRAPTTQRLVASSLQMLVEPSGHVVIAWLEDSPARLKVMRLDPASGTWTQMTLTGDGFNALNNPGPDDAARDVGLGRDALGRLVVAWTQGGVSPRLFVKRQNADLSWSQLGGTPSPGVTTRSPFIAGDPNSQLYLTYTRFYSGDLMTVNPETDIFVTRWIHP